MGREHFKKLEVGLCFEKVENPCFRVTLVLFSILTLVNSRPFPQTKDIICNPVMSISLNVLTGSLALLWKFRFRNSELAESPLMKDRRFDYFQEAVRTVVLFS